MLRKNPYSPDLRPLPPPGERPILIELRRGNAGESRHRVHAAICDASGKIVEHWGDLGLKFFPRSAIKIIQAASWLTPAIRQKFLLEEEELSIACGSHEGEPAHVAVVEAWLKKIGLGVDALSCGAHDPYHRESARALWRKGEAPCPLHNNCSGKHCGFLTACLAEGWPTAGYTNYDHPLQARVRKVAGEFFGLELGARPWGIDGCGIPTYHVPLESLARAMAKLTRPESLGSQIHEAVEGLNAAIAAHPKLIGGAMSFSSKVVAETRGRVFAKMGAEGVYGLWIPESGLGIAVKCEDGATRGSEAAVAAILGSLGHPLRFYSGEITRWSGEVVGQIG
jgi:L-asparaginase II